MKLSIPKDVLIEVLSDIVKIATTSPLATNVPTTIAIIAHEDGLNITGSNTTSILERYVPLHSVTNKAFVIEKAGIILVSAKYIYEMIKKLEGTIQIESINHSQIQIASGEIQLQMNCFPSSDRPTLPSIQTANIIQIESSMLRRIITETSFAVSTSDTRPILTGVNWTLTDGKLICAATNSHRMAMSTITISHHAPLSIVIPGQSMKMLEKILPITNEPISISVHDNMIIFQMENRLYYSRLLTGHFPKVNNLVPSNATTTITLTRQQFLASIERAILLASTSDYTISIKTLENNRINISASHSEIGTIEESHHVISISGEEATLSLNSKFLMETLKSMKAEQITMKLFGTMKPIVIEPNDDSTVLHLISPVRTR
jgi:DNA polymerase III subunit beta